MLIVLNCLQLTTLKTKFVISKPYNIATEILLMYFEEIISFLYLHVLIKMAVINLMTCISLLACVTNFYKFIYPNTH
jgi:hypothetical protein